MGVFRDYLNEARDSSVPAEFRIAIGQLKRMYNTGEVPELKELQKDAEMIAKKNHLDTKKFIEFAIKQYGLNESAIDSILSEAKKVYDKNATPEQKADAIISRCKSFRTDSEVGHLLDDADIIQGIKDATKWDWKESEKYFKDNYKSIKINESAVGKPGRTTVKDAEDHIDDELIAEFKKIIKKLGGKMVAKVLLDKLSTKAEIKDEIDHIEDLIDNSNY